MHRFPLLAGFLWLMFRSPMTEEEWRDAYYTVHEEDSGQLADRDPGWLVNDFDGGMAGGTGSFEQ